MANREEELRKDYSETEKVLGSYLSARYGGAIVSLGNPSGGKFFYPVNKRRTRESTDAMILAEKYLDAFWRAMDREMASVSAFSPRLRQLLSQRVLQRTPEWVEPSKTTESKSSKGDIGTLTMPLSELHFQLEQNKERTLTWEKPPAPKAKVKTHGLSRMIEATPQQLDRPALDSQPTFKVDRRALKVFSTLFFTPSTSSQPGEVAWGDFLHALSLTGFTAKKLYGSVWQFSPSKLDIEQPIQFHEPHPIGKIPFTTARRHGRRLSRAYGWHVKMFVLE